MCDNWTMMFRQDHGTQCDMSEEEHESYDIWLVSLIVTNPLTSDLKDIIELDL